MPSNILHQAAEWFKARSTPISTWYDDDRGRYAFRVQVRDQAFIVTAKNYLHAGNASFMAEKVVQRAADSGAYLLLFVAANDTKGDPYRYVYDPAAVTDYGDPSDPADSPRTEHGEDWLDVDARFGVPFQDWYDHGDTPPRHPDWDTNDPEVDDGQQPLDAYGGPTNEKD